MLRVEWLPTTSVVRPLPSPLRRNSRRQFNTHLLIERSSTCMTQQISL